MSVAAETEPLTEEAFEKRLQDIGRERYHHRHPFNVRMHAGTLSPDEIRSWVANRYYYQTRIPIKDGLILAKAQDAAFRRDWVRRIHDHDGRRAGEGGLELWLALGDAVGLDRDRIASFVDVVPGVRRACDAYVEFVAGHGLLESVAASLTELFAGDIMKIRIDAFEKHYPWVRTDGLDYFRSRTKQAPADAAFGLSYVKREATTRAGQDRCTAALERKCEILWSLLDALEIANGRPCVSPHAIARLDDAEPMIVLSERAVKLGGSGREIVALCDGTRTTREIVAVLVERHPGQPRLADDVYAFVEEMVGLSSLTLASNPR